MTHGLTITESASGARSIVPASLAVIGLVGTAPNAAPDVKASAETGVVANNNALTFTSKKTGREGNGTSISLVNPGANDAAIAVTVEGDAITVSLATGAGGAITTTAAQLKAAIEGSAPANALVAVAATETSTGVGIVTALPLTQLAGGVDAPFPLDTPVLIAGSVDAAAGQMGNGGTLKAALTAIGDQATPIVVVVRVAEDPEDQDVKVIGEITDGRYTGLQALLAAKAQIGVRPRIIGCPSLDSAPVVAEMVSVAEKLRGMAYAAAIGDSVGDAVTYRGDYSARELMLIWPGTSNAFAGDIVARSLGLRAKIDEQQGWHKTISNVALNGITGLSKDVHFDLLDPSTEAGVLNDGQVTTIIRQNGFRLWGNRTCADPETAPQWSFESAVRTSHALQDEIESIVAPFVDQPMTLGLIKDLLETGNARFRQLVTEGRIIGAQMFFDQDENTAQELAAGRPHFRIQFTPAAPLENPQIALVITDFYYTGFADLLV